MLRRALITLINQLDVDGCIRPNRNSPRWLASTLQGSLRRRRAGAPFLRFRDNSRVTAAASERGRQGSLPDGAGLALQTGGKGYGVLEAGKNKKLEFPAVNGSGVGDPCFRIRRTWDGNLNLNSSSWIEAVVMCVLGLGDCIIRSSLQQCPDEVSEMV